MSDAKVGLAWNGLLTQLVTEHHVEIQKAICGKHVLGVILHDHWICMDLCKQWRPETMTFGVPTQWLTPPLGERFTTFLRKYISILPALACLSRI